MPSHTTLHSIQCQASRAAEHHCITHWILDRSPWIRLRASWQDLEEPARKKESNCFWIFGILSPMNFPSSHSPVAVFHDPSQLALFVQNRNKENPANLSRGLATRSGRSQRDRFPSYTINLPYHRHNQTPIVAYILAIRVPVVESHRIASHFIATAQR